MPAGSVQRGLSLLAAVVYLGAWAAFLYETQGSSSSVRLVLAFYIASHILVGLAIGRPTAAWLVLAVALMALVPGAGLWPLVVLWAVFAVLLVWLGVVVRRLAARRMG